MRLVTAINPTTEVYVEHRDISVMVNPWHNAEGVNLILTGKHLATRLAGTLTWEEVDALILALSAARST